MSLVELKGFMSSLDLKQRLIQLSIREHEAMREHYGCIELPFGLDP